MTKRDYIEYIDDWMSRKGNYGISFTYGAAMYDGIKESRFDFDDLGIRDELNQTIQAESNANMDWIENLSDDAVAEIIDIDVLDTYGREIQEQVNDEDMEDIFDDLDLIPEFETREEFENKVNKLVEDKGNSDLNRRAVANKYEEEHYLSIKEEEND